MNYTAIINIHTDIKIIDKETNEFEIGEFHGLELYEGKITNILIKQNNHVKSFKIHKIDIELIKYDINGSIV